MPATQKGAWKLQEVRDAILANEWNYDSSLDPRSLWRSGQNNQFGILANNSSGGYSPLRYSSPVQLPGSWKQMAFSNPNNDVKAAIKTDNTAWVWGGNAFGNLGLNVSADTSRYSSPVQLPGTWCRIQPGRSSVNIAFKSDNTAWIWGYNGIASELGLNVPPDNGRSSPTQIPGTSWCGGSTGLTSGLLKTDNTLWTWGGGFGSTPAAKLGLNTPSTAFAATTFSSPTQVGGTGWCKFCFGEDIAVAIKTDNTLWMWGSNSRGELGLNGTGGQRSSPVQVPGTSWCFIEPAGISIYAIKNDNTLWSWGYNHQGYLGLNDTTSRSSPTQVPGTNWCSVNFSSQYAVAGLKTDGTAWIWGNDSYFGFNKNSTTSVLYSSPIQLPGSWECISSGNCGFWGLKT